ncbi:HAD hydrolase family protein [Glaciecola sp. 1036]|uniref:HAD hydrolase family protein n=1 Tax=Alteromonadaceae TaxID=72275 RepID=UPI003D064483
MKNIVIDLDSTLTLESDLPYEKKEVNESVKTKLLEYKQKGFNITIFTSRNMRTYEGDISKINANTLPIIINWLEEKQIPYDGIVVGKPWCGFEGFYIDDRAIRPSEFANLTYEEIEDLLKRETEIANGQTK